MKELCVATKNKGKAAEIRRILDGSGADVKTLLDFDGAPDVIEDGTTFEENARKKAREIYAFCGIPTLADDSGLEVEALGGAPGVYSARFAGEPCNDDANNAKLLAELVIRGKIKPETRAARFVCVLVYFDGETEVITKGYFDGWIGYEPKGENGFGYDPLFISNEKGLTAAQLEPDVKNAISHRGKALASMAKELKERSLLKR